MEAAMDFFRKHATILSLVGVAAVIMASILGIYSRYIFSGFLYFDDTQLLPQAVFDVDRPFRTRFLIIDAVAKFGSFAALKVASSLYQPAIAVLIVLVLKRLGVAISIAFGLALFIVTYPLATDQPFFVTGSHSAIGLFWALCSLYAFMLAYEDATRRFFALMIASFALAVVAAVSSPTMMIATFGPIIWILTAMVFKRTRAEWALFTAAAAAVFSAIFFAFQFSHHEYLPMKGWLSYAPAEMITNLGVAISMIFAETLGAPIFVSVVYFGGFAAIAAIALRPAYSGAGKSGRGLVSSNPVERARLFIFSSACLVMAALSFSPASIIVNFRDRYIVPAFALTALAILAPLAIATSRKSQSFRFMSLTILVVLAGMNIWMRHLDVAERFDPYLATHNKIAELAASEKEHWPKRAQIVILLSDDAPFVTGGFKRQSTWYLRSLTRRKDILGLIGPAKLAKGSPFDPEASFSGKQYWREKNGRAERVKMFGLELGRPLFVYELDATGRPLLTPVIFNSQEGRVLVRSGAVPAKVMKASNRILDCEVSSPEAFIWTGDSVAGGAKRTTPPIGNSC